MKQTQTKIKMTTGFKGWFYGQMRDLGVEPKDRQAFMRGCLSAMVLQLERSKKKDWKKFMREVDPMAKEHLGCSLGDDSVEDVLVHGFDGPVKENGVFVWRKK